MPQAGFESVTPANDRPQTIALDRSATFLLFFFSLPVPPCPDFAICPYCTTQTTQISMLPAGFEPVTPASDRPQTLVLDRSATGTGNSIPGPFSP
jgi:hypothetical protein